jgi:hypothetical protein
LFAEDINQLTGRGIPIIQELARQFGVSDSQVKKLVESGQVGFPAIERAFVDMTSEGGKFAGMMAQQSRTTKGLFSTLKDTVNGVFLTLGIPLNDALRPMLGQVIGLAQKLVPLAARAELTAELARVDASVSNRLAADAYTAPASAEIAAVKAVTDQLNPARLANVATVDTPGTQIAAALSPVV